MKDRDREIPCLNSYYLERLVNFLKLEYKKYHKDMNSIMENEIKKSKERLAKKDRELGITPVFA